MSRKRKTVIATIALLTATVVAGLTLLSVYLFTKKDALDYVSIPTETLDETYYTVIDKTDYYLGHPDLVYTGENKLLIAYPLGHGKGEIVMRESTDKGISWSAPRSDLPASFAYSQETPTLYRLDFNDGTEKILLVSGCPSWAEDDEYYANGFNYSLSSDGGRTFGEFENAYGIDWANSMPDRGDPIYETYPADEMPVFDGSGNVLPYDVIVAMSSLTKLKDENGNWLDVWMGTFHDYDFYNYVSFLTFDSEGKAHWSNPKRFLSSQRETESGINLCEIEIFRTPTDELVLLGRANARNSNSVISVSTNEGKTWSELKELPYSLTGDRHKAEYDPVTKKVVVSFRLYLPEMKPNALSQINELGGYWVAWVGSPEDLTDYALNSEKNKNSVLSDKMLVLGKTNDGKSDCGYAGVIIADGTVTMASYGKFERGAKVPYILGVSFPVEKLG